MFSKYQVFILFVLVPILATACGPAKPIALTIAENGGHVNINVGSQIIITLDGNPSTGYTWETKDLDTKVLEQIGDPIFISNNPGLVGSGGILTLTFKALQTGTTTLTLIYHRPWETGVDPLDTYSITVIVKK
jgi:inhibitor of cysteine peptidase